MDQVNTSPISLREATLEDTEAIVAIYVESSNMSYEGRDPWREVTPARIIQWRHDLSTATPTRWWAAEESGSIVGFIGIGPSRDLVEKGLGELDTIAVAPTHWHRGIGKLMMVRAIEGLRESGFNKAILWTHADYPLAERFYRSTGWVRSPYTRQSGKHVRYDFSL